MQHRWQLERKSLAGAAGGADANRPQGTGGGAARRPGGRRARLLRQIRRRHRRHCRLAVQADELHQLRERLRGQGAAAGGARAALLGLLPLGGPTAAALPRAAAELSMIDDVMPPAAQPGSADDNAALLAALLLLCAISSQTPLPPMPGLRTPWRRAAAADVRPSVRDRHATTLVGRVRRPSCGKPLPLYQQHPQKTPRRRLGTAKERPPRQRRPDRSSGLCQCC